MTEPYVPKQPICAWSIAMITLAFFASLAVDLWSKDWVLDRLSAPSAGASAVACEPTPSGDIPMQRRPVGQIDIIPGYLDLRYVENCGAAFGMLRNAHALVRHVVFGLAALVACIALLWRLFRGNPSTIYAWAIPWILSGAIGNMVDRARLGYVVDFIHLHLGERFHWPTFNVADIAITVGVGLLLLDAPHAGHARQAQPAAGGDAPQPS